ncbi:MAG: transglutaminase domain-containing protein [Spirochaetaceae bacterium]|jgi:transglutaminase-like putative cysteine protease|nr:transglutaminase domain-containing protein [Spirochaetaceae bacterium]
MRKRWFGLSVLLGCVSLHAGAANFFENFDGAKLDARQWTGDFSITNAADEIKAKDRLLFENDTSFVKLSAALDTVNSLQLSPLKAAEASILSFRYRTEIDKRAQQSFTVSIDGVEKASYDGVGVGWRTGRIALDAGSHQVEFRASAKRAQVSGAYNAVYLDDIRLFPDKAVSLRIFPQGSLDTVAGAEGHLVFTADALREDGSVKPDAGPLSWTVSAGAGVAENAAAGSPNSVLFSAEKPGTYTVNVKMGGLSALTVNVTAHSADFLQKPYTYPGTGKTYAGFVKAAKGSGPAPGTDNITLTAPAAADFEADAFFLLAGKISTKPAGKNYARMEITKEGSQPPLRTWRIIKGDFAERIWLPFGPGVYKAVIQPFDTVTLTTPPKGEGALRGGSFASTTLPVEFRITNTRDESKDIPDGDGRWIYPSFYIQADDFAITNLMHSLTGSLKTVREKVAAVHDYIVSTFVYDQQSFVNPGRSRKMDALSALKNKIAVCEGYTYLSAALLRSAGIPVRIVTSRGINHAWNNVYLDGKWLFYDATWDDPVPDRSPEIVGRTYFLLESLTGGDTRHGTAGKIMTGDAE